MDCCKYTRRKYESDCRDNVDRQTVLEKRHSSLKGPFITADSLSFVSVQAAGSASSFSFSYNTDVHVSTAACRATAAARGTATAVSWTCVRGMINVIYAAVKCYSFITCRLCV